jgi:hypothetical protein
VPMSQGDDNKDPVARANDFLQMFKKGAEFTQDLLRENERLRYRIVKLEEALKAQDPTLAADTGETAELQRKIAVLEQEKVEILDRIKAAEEENKDFANRYVEVEEENSMLANLYIASYQLHATLDFKEVLEIVQESVINLIGAEEFSVLLLDEKTRKLEPVASEGIDTAMLPSIALGEGVIGRVAETGEYDFIASMEGYTRDFVRPLACMPLKIKDHVIGVIVLYKLLEPKTKFSNLDYELLTLLAGHAATAIFSSRIYSDSERKLATIQGFIDLLTQ